MFSHSTKIHEIISFIIIAGVPPTDARDFISFLSSPERSHSLSHLRYSVLALGDSNYPHYCRTGKNVDSLYETDYYSLHPFICLSSVLFWVFLSVCLA